jgi:hypothetical protein
MASFCQPAELLFAASSGQERARGHPGQGRLTDAPWFALRRAGPAQCIPKDRLASSMARRSASWSGVLMMATQLHKTRIQADIARRIPLKPDGGRVNALDQRSGKMKEAANRGAWLPLSRFETAV